jgi:hypothetical protein
MFDLVKNAISSHPNPKVISLSLSSSTQLRRRECVVHALMCMEGYDCVLLALWPMHWAHISMDRVTDTRTMDVGLAARRLSAHDNASTGAQDPDR